MIKAWSSSDIGLCGDRILPGLADFLPNYLCGGWARVTNFGASGESPEFNFVFLLVLVVLNFQPRMISAVCLQDVVSHRMCKVSNPWTLHVCVLELSVLQSGAVSKLVECSSILRCKKKIMAFWLHCIAWEGRGDLTLWQGECRIYLVPCACPTSCAFQETH